MTYRASLGTRGELRRIAAEAESVTIDHVRPWIRKVQPCRLAPHVIVPQWIRLENPVKPKPPPPLVSQSRIASSELVEEILESATARKFRRGRGRRGRPRKRVESGANPELKPTDAEDVASGQVTSEPVSGAAEVAREAEKETVKEAEAPAVPPVSDENMATTEKAEISVREETYQPNADDAKDETVEKKQQDIQDAPKEDIQSTTEPPLENTDSRIPEENLPVSGQDGGDAAGPSAPKDATEEQKNIEDVQMTEMVPEAPGMSPQ